MSLTWTSWCSEEPNISFDGYIRLKFQSLSTLQFEHRFAWEDPDLLEELVLDDFPARIAGYCEWATSAERAQVSLGWAWYRASENSRAFIAPGGLSSNIMLLTGKSEDMGLHRTNRILIGWLSDQSWQPPISLSKACSLPAFGRGRFS